MHLIEEGNNLRDPLEAEAHITPEGYDVSTIEGAETYLTEMHGIILPEAGGPTDAGTGYHLALALQRENRAAIYEGAERRQNVAEHSAKLAITTVWKASKERPDLNSGTVSIMATFHDMIEAYGKDTIITDEEALVSKPWREKAAMTLLRRDLHDSPLLDVLEEYEACESPEARFVKAMDKVEAYQFALNSKATLHRLRKEDFADIVEVALPKAAIDHTAFGLMKEVLKQLGRKWEAWGCKPFEGDPDEIVESLAAEIEVAPAPQTIESIHEELDIDKIDTPLGPEGIGQQPELDPQRARQVGVVLLSEYRAQRDRPPLPPTPAAAGLAAF